MSEIEFKDETARPAVAGDTLVGIDSSGNPARVSIPGIAKTYQDVSGSRSASTNYTNDTGYDIFVTVTVQHTSGNLSAALSIDDVQVASVSDIAASLGGSSSTRSLSIQVPSGAEYKVNISGCTIIEWWELR